MIDKATSDWLELAQRVKADLRRHFKQRVIDVVDSNKNQWEDRANKLVDGWEKIYKSNSFMAFCRHDGRFQPKGKEEVCWNDKIQNLTGEKLVKAFDAFDEDLPALEKEYAKDIQDLFQSLIDTLGDCEDFEGFYDYVRSVAVNVQESVAGVFANFRHKVRAIRHECTLDQAKNEPSTFVAKAMQPAYDDCWATWKDKDIGGKNDKGGKRREMFKRMKQQMRGTKEVKSIFSSVSDMVSPSSPISYTVSWTSRRLIAVATRFHCLR